MSKHEIVKRWIAGFYKESWNGPFTVKCLAFDCIETLKQYQVVKTSIDGATNYLLHYRTVLRKDSTDSFCSEAEALAHLKADQERRITQEKARLQEEQERGKLLGIES